MFYKVLNTPLPSIEDNTLITADKNKFSIVAKIYSADLLVFVDYFLKVMWYCLFSCVEKLSFELSFQNDLFDKLKHSHNMKDKANYFKSDNQANLRVLEILEESHLF